MSDSIRAEVARQQAELVRALVTRDGPPTGFDVERIKLASEMLAQKRARAVAHVWPRLSESLNPNFLMWFREYSNEYPLPDEGAINDGRNFAAWLNQKQRLPDEGRLELLLDGLRHGILRMARLSEEKCVVIGVRLPWYGVRVFRCFRR